MSDDTERKIKTLVREWERRIAVVEAQREQATSILIKGLFRDEKSRYIAYLFDLHTSKARYELNR